MMNKEQKKLYIADMTNQFENSKAVMVTHYQGLTMPQLDELRSKMREHGIVFKITKNRITKLALEKTRRKAFIKGTADYTDEDFEESKGEKRAQDKLNRLEKRLEKVQKK